MRYATFLALMVLALPGISSAAPAKPMPFVIVKMGDDALSASFADAVTKAFAASPAFIASSDATAVKVTMTDKARPSFRVARPEMQYAVDFVMGGKKLGSSRGQCLQREPDACANSVLKDAIAATRNLP